MKQQKKIFHHIISAALALIVIGQACTLSLFENPFNSSPTAIPLPGGPTPTPQPTAQTTFIAILPEPLQAGETLALAIVDETTGLPLNPVYHPMTARDSLTYTVSLPLLINAVVKYRYIKQTSAQIFEDDTSGNIIRYRMAHITGAGEITDIINDWADKAYARSTGSILGQVFNADTGSPVPNMLVTAGGLQSITDSAGRFELPELPIGTHNLLAYSLDGMYQTFQQGAVVADGQSTIVDLRVKPARMVNVTFVVSIPPSTVPGVPVRVAGNLLQLGNTFADLQGGISAIADRMPILSLQADGRYATTISLPVGAHLQYKYTLGDGYWNAEHANNGAWVLRDIIIPEQDIVLQDYVATWQAGESAPILFEVSVPSVTPSGDIIYIQFNTNGWAEPLPMWPLGNNKWAYKLYGPLHTLGAFHYRYCRNGQCGSADDAQTEGFAASGRKVITSVTAQDLKDTVSAWKWYENPEPIALVGTNITPRDGGFIAGVEFQPTYRPNWSYFVPQAIVNAQALGTNMVIVTPTWTYTKINPLRFKTVPGKDPLWIDSAIMISQTRALGLNVGLFPIPNFPSTPADFWNTAPRDALWWQNWFARYRAFIVHYADLAAQTGAQTLILGGDWIAPALPNGTMPDGTASNAPADADAQWKSIIADVRARFKGQVLWALPYTKASLQAPLNFLQDADGVYLLWSAKLASSPVVTKTDYANEAGLLLDNEVSALASLLKKPIILALAYPSASGSASGCVPSSSGACLDWMSLSKPNADVNSVSLDLQTQANLYEAMLIAVNSRPWISGFVARGFYPPAMLQDKSASIHGKPAADILWYWYPRLTGAVR